MSYAIPKEEVSEAKRVLTKYYDYKRALSNTGISTIIPLTDGFEKGVEFAESHYSPLLESLESVISMQTDRLEKLSSGKPVRDLDETIAFAKSAIEQLSKYKQP